MLNKLTFRLCEVAADLRKHPKTIRNWARLGLIDGVRQNRRGGHYRVRDTAAFTRWLEAQLSRVGEFQIYNSAEREELLRQAIEELLHREHNWKPDERHSIKVSTLAPVLGMSRASFYRHGFHREFKRMCSNLNGHAGEAIGEWSAFGRK